MLHLHSQVNKLFQARSFYIGKNKNRADSSLAEDTIITHLFPWIDQDNKITLH